MSFAVGARQRIEVDPLPKTKPDSMLEEVGFLTTNVAAMRVYLERHGLVVEEEGKDGIRTTDPEGNEIGFVSTPKMEARDRGGGAAGGDGGCAYVAEDHPCGLAGA